MLDEILRCAQNDKGALGAVVGIIKNGWLILSIAKNDRDGGWVLFSGSGFVRWFLGSRVL